MGSGYETRVSFSTTKITILTKILQFFSNNCTQGCKVLADFQGFEKVDFNSFTVFSLLLWRCGILVFLTPPFLLVSLQTIWMGLPWDLGIFLDEPGQDEICVVLSSEDLTVRLLGLNSGSTNCCLCDLE